LKPIPASWCALALAWTPFTATAQTLAAADMRPGLSLDGAWHWSVDPYRDGVAGFHGGPPGESTARFQDRIQADEAERRPTALFEFDMQRSPVTHLPGSWIGHAPEMRYYQGLVWYQRTFAWQPAGAGKRVYLRFGSADYAASVFLNGKPVGRHVGAFTPFAFDVTELLRPGSNQITLGVDSARTDKDVPPPVTDWETYGGITRSIRLVTVPETFVDDAFVRLGKDGRIAVSAHLLGPQAAGTPIRLAIPALGATLAGRTDADGNWTASLAAPRTLQRWSPDSPKLYDVEITSGADRFTDRIGFRTIEVLGDRILLNGKSIFLRGISMHEEELGKDPVRAMSPAAARTTRARHAWPTRWGCWCGARCPSTGGSPGAMPIRWRPRAG
jgi:beta-glucuronidase